jgi:hypothetical protein
MALHSFNMGEGGADDSAMEGMAGFFGPGYVDQTIRQAIDFCWMALPKERRNADEVEKEIRRIVDRALRDFREDSEAFGRST